MSETIRYALVSDIHANLPALEAVLADIERRGDFDAVFHLGDLVGYAPWPDETVALIAARGIAGVAGNYDSTVAHDYKHCGCRYEDALQEELSHLSYEWTRAHVTAATKAFLGALPFRLDARPFGGHGSGRNVVLVHGTPTLNTVYWTEDRPATFNRKMIAAAGLGEGDVLCFGHTHKPWHKEVDGVLLVNTGSVGRPKDHDWRAGYVALTLADGSAEVEVLRVEYDVERAAQAILESDLPAGFAHYLRSGGASLEAP